MTSIRVGLVALFLALAGSAFAQAPATTSGAYDHDSVHIALTHVTALSQDNAEGLLDHPRQVRLVFSDQDVPIGALYEAVFPPVRDMAKLGQVRGVMLEFDPADRTAVSITPLVKPDDPSSTLATITRTNSEGLWRQLTVTETTISGDYQDADTGLRVTFSAPLAVDAIVADLKGPAAQSSAPVRALIARAEAMRSGDLTAAAALTARSASDGVKSMSPEEVKGLSAPLGEMIASLKRVPRVVIRQHSAVALMGGGESANLLFEDGAWKVAD
ncbi:MAG TPA: hypothetical protein VHY32_05395 [Caulobacteraceae bacterium]|jgi:hypothetical protein|nr:hypothetical protein [Caulobacteraceae bacterium]